jgi:hypothetical protein
MREWVGDVTRHQRDDLGSLGRPEVTEAFTLAETACDRFDVIGERLHPRIFAEALAPLAGGLFRAAQAPPDGCVVEAALGQKHDAGTLDVALWRQSATSNTLQLTRRCPRNRQRQCSSTWVPSTYRLDWAALLLRVFGVDVLKCSRCQGQMRLIACIEEPDVAKKILVHLGLPSEPLPTARAQAPPVTLELFPAA